MEKAELLAEKFFPTLPEIDLTDMESSRSRPTFEVSSEITEEDVKVQIKRTAPDKAPGHDKIPNRFWKLTAGVVSEHLAKLFSKCLEAGVCPAHFKKSITVVLRKERKENYQAVSAYRPIALLNTIGKLLEAILAKMLSAALEEHKLLPESQMGARKGRSTVTALQLLTEQIHTIWGAKKNQVASMLCLDMVGAYDHVSHARLLHILKCKGSAEVDRVYALWTNDNNKSQWVVQPNFFNQGGRPSGGQSLLNIVYLI